MSLSMTTIMNILHLRYAFLIFSLLCISKHRSLIVFIACNQPSTSIQPSSSANPSMSNHPSFLPSSSLQPSTSSVPSSQPSLSSQPSMSPQPSNKPSSCDGELKILLRTDRHPEDTSYEIKSMDTVVYSNTMFQLPNSWYSQDVCLSLGETYIFTIYDSFDDGICCTTGRGTFTLLIDDAVIFDFSYGENGNNFTEIFSVPFSLDATAAPSSQVRAKDGATRVQN